MKYDITLEGLYGDDYRDHIKEGCIYAVCFPVESDAARESGHDGAFPDTIPQLIKVTKVTPTYAAYVLFDHPDAPERTFGMNSVMSLTLIEIK